MKTTMFKVIAVLLLSFTLVQNSNAYGTYFHHYYAPRGYYAPRVYAPVVAAGPCYGRVMVPGHWFINRYGVREYAHPYYR